METLYLIWMKHILYLIIDNEKALVVLGESNINCAEVINGKEGFTVVPLIRGALYACIESVFSIFKNGNEIYPIFGVPEDLEHVLCRAVKKRWMDRRVFSAMFLEDHFDQPDVQENEKIIFLDNMSSHQMTSELERILHEVHTSLSQFPGNSTHKFQLLGTGIQKVFKEIWREIWAEKKIGLTEKCE